MYIAPSSGHILLNINFPFKLILSKFDAVFDVWSENAALFERLMEIHSNPPIQYYGFNYWDKPVSDSFYKIVQRIIWKLQLFLNLAVTRGR